MSRIAYYPFLKKSRLIRPGEAEEHVRLALYNELLTQYHYPPDLIDIEVPVLIREDEQPRYADIVVFTDVEHKRPYLVVEAKRPKREDGEKQGQRYATILRAVYVLWSNGTQRACSVLVNRYPEDASSIADIPEFQGDAVQAISELRPFRDDKHIADTFRKCHGLIRNLSHLKPDDAFTEFLKVLLVKFKDESEGDDYEFQILLKGDPAVPESENETAQRVRQIFKTAVDEDNEISSVFQAGDEIALTNDCIAQIVQELQPYSFATTPVDQKGRAFESFISGDMRQEFKEFMTPRQVVDAMVQMADPDASTSILDPCCGSAAFLISSLKHVRNKIEAKPGYNERQKVKSSYDFAHDRLWGMDASLQMSSVARINMLVNDDGRSHIYLNDSLKPKKDAPDALRLRSFKLILTNPPFGKRIAAKSTVLDHFEVAKDADGRKIRTGSIVTEVLFLERNLEWLAPGGMLFIVLPDSVLGNSGLQAARNYIERQARIVAVVSLPADTFGPSGAKTKTSFVVLEKRNKELDHDEYDEYKTFTALINDVGHDFTGRATNRNDLSAVVSDYALFRDGYEPKSIFVKIVDNAELDKAWLAQRFFDDQIGKKGKGTSTLLLRDVCTIINAGKTAPRSEYVEAGHHLVKVGNLTGRGIEWEAVERQFVSERFAAKNPNAVLENSDILLTAAAHGPKWIGLKVDICDGAPNHLLQPVLFCAELMRLRVDPESGIDPYYVLMFLRSNAGYAEIQRCIRGQSGHIYRDEVGAIQLPNPNALNQSDDSPWARAVRVWAACPRPCPLC